MERTRVHRVMSQQKMQRHGRRGGIITVRLVFELWSLLVELFLHGNLDSCLCRALFSAKKLTSFKETLFLRCEARSNVFLPAGYQSPVPVHHAEKTTRKPNSNDRETSFSSASRFRRDAPDWRRHMLVYPPSSAALGATKQHSDDKL